MDGGDPSLPVVFASVVDDAMDIAPPVGDIGVGADAMDVVVDSGDPHIEESSPVASSGPINIAALDEEVDLGEVADSDDEERIPKALKGKGKRRSASYETDLEEELDVMRMSLAPTLVRRSSYLFIVVWLAF